MEDQHSVHDVASIEFGLFSADEIRKMAVVKIDSSKLSGPGSVYDEKLGHISDTNEKCPTCGLKTMCPGHWGYIDLAEPILHPMYLKYITIFLRCFCKNCHRLLLSAEQAELTGFGKSRGERRFNRILELIEKKGDTCPECQNPQPKVVYKSKDATIALEYKAKKGEKNSILLGVDDIKKIFDGILDTDVTLLGIDPSRSHPRNLVLTVLPVIPTCARPPVISDGNVGDDDTSFSLIEIIKINNQLTPSEDKKEVPEVKRTKLLQALKFRISTMFNNSKNRAKHPTDSRPLKGLKERLAGKQGRLRSNLMGKRVDFSARTVIGSEPTLKLDQVGVPYEVARIETKPVMITDFNIEHLTKIVNDGKANFLITMRKRKDDDTEVKTRINLQYAMFRRGTELLYGDVIIRDDTEIKVENGSEILQPGDRLMRDGQFVEVKYPSKKHINLKIGDVVEVQLEKGDYVAYNRQPTLHRGSMMALQVVPLPYKTFRHNLAACKQWNSDFDGDEMNIHVGQSYETQAEFKYIMASPLHIITAQESKPLTVITQDSLIAMYLMTKDNLPLQRHQFCDISLKGETPDGKPLYSPERIRHIERVLKIYKKSFSVFSSRGLISLLFPLNFNYEKKNNIIPGEPVVEIKQGVFLSGAFDKGTLGSSHGSVIQILNKEYGWKIAANFIDNAQFIANAWLLIQGFSIGLEDCMITSETSVDSINSTLAHCYMKAEGIEETTRNPGIREIRVTAALSQAKDIGMKIAKEAMRPSNNFLTTVISGTKGDFFNIAQLTGLLGQQNLESGRVMPSLNHKKRTLVHYPLGPMSKEREYESRGFVHSSFIKGLMPEEFFFHATSGRESISDSAMATAKSGYIQRKIVKVCEDIQIQYDQTVRDMDGKIYQFAYGENNFDATKTVHVKGKPAICDIAHLVDRLNTSLELGIKEDFDEKTKVKFTLLAQPENIREKKGLIERFSTRYPNIKVDENWTVEELKNRMRLVTIPERRRSVSEDSEKSDTSSGVEEDTEEEDEESEAETEEEEEKEEKVASDEEEREMLKSSDEDSELEDEPESDDGGYISFDGEF